MLTASWREILPSSASRTNKLWSSRRLVERICRLLQSICHAAPWGYQSSLRTSTPCALAFAWSERVPCSWDATACAPAASASSKRASKTATCAGFSLHRPAAGRHHTLLDLPRDEQEQSRRQLEHGA